MQKGEKYDKKEEKHEKNVEKNWTSKHLAQVKISNA